MNKKKKIKLNKIFMFLSVFFAITTLGLTITTVIFGIQNNKKENNNEVDKLKKEIAELNNRIAELEQDKENNKKEIAELTEKVNELENNKKDLENQIAELNNRIAELEQDKENNKKEIAELTEKVNELENNKKDLENQIAELNNKIAELENIIIGLTKDINYYIKNPELLSTIYIYKNDNKESIPLINSLMREIYYDNIETISNYNNFEIEITQLPNKDNNSIGVFKIFPKKDINWIIGSKEIIFYGNIQTLDRPELLIDDIIKDKNISNTSFYKKDFENMTIAKILIKVWVLNELRKNNIMSGNYEYWEVNEYIINENELVILFSSSILNTNNIIGYITLYMSVKWL